MKNGGVNMKTLYVHIGMLGTDTTLIQDFLSKNLEMLRKNDIFYPVNKNKSYVIWNHHTPLVTAITGENIPMFKDRTKYLNKSVLEEFIHDLENATENNVLISSDAFSSLFEKKHIISLKKNFNKYNGKIIVYVRRQDEFIISNFQNAVREGRQFNISLEQIAKFEHAKYYHVIHPWIRVFGEKNVIIRIFSENEFYRNDLFSDFMNILGVNLHNTQVEVPQKHQQDSISYEKALFLKKLSNYLVALDDITNEKRFNHHEIRNLVINNNSNSVGDINNFLSFSERLEIMRIFSKDNMKTAKKFLKRKNGVLFDDVSNKPKGELKYKKDLSEDEFIEKLVNLAEEMFNKQKKRDEIYARLISSIRETAQLTSEEIQFNYNLIQENNLFDRDFYLDTYVDIKQAGIDPLMHYIKWGWYEGRNPSNSFNTKEYVIENLELIDQGVNPLVHFKMNS
ncbi:hypothetical protein PAECIP111891_03218 [Paenibacillus allorhizoplanae]|uniref:Sulfotransferase family protein n=1 Tax=Paenibacillus allorhizoplanae TaxID=2905648 RepID=A0ABM9CBN9_9BACL|nr:hypothetical protein [Paenibacillus allorhizoplanae]CAH1208429.1 hypothetical protein PAECIP111891_03218 [Paenibacillus allorhizoplanae]